MNLYKERIFIKQWLFFKPYDKQTITDDYYLKLCNKVKQSISKCEHITVNSYLSDEFKIDMLSCFLTSYFEDLISETNIWSTFIRVHKRMYGKYLPFYRADEYFEKEINLADVYFLVWYYINTTQSAGFLFPHHILISEIAENVMEVFDDEWEYAPENNLLKSYYVIDESENDYYIARKLIDTVLFKSYLFSIDSFFDLVDSEKEIIENHDDDSQHIVNYLNENRDQKLHETHTRLLGLKGNEWVAEILGNNHRLYDSYKKISKKLVGYFLYKGQDEKNLFIEHIASGKKFSLTKKSIDRPQLLSKIDTIMHMGIVQWQTSGGFREYTFKPITILI